VSSSDNFATGPVDIDAIMRDVRERIREEMNRVPNGSRPVSQDWWEERSKESRAELESQFTPLVHNPELHRLNTTYAGWFQKPEIRTHRRILGRLIVKWKMYMFDLIGRQLFGEYLRREEEFQIQLVRFLNAVATHVDNRDERLFWQVMHKVDNDVHALHARADILYDEATKSVATLSEQVRCVSGRGGTPAHERWPSSDVDDRSPSEQCPR
jgi:hypothetical protein